VDENRNDEEATRQPGITLAHLREAASGMSASEFAERFAEAFLVLSDATLEGPGGPGATVLRFDEPGSHRASGDGSRETILHPIRRTGRSVGHLVSTGRTPNNDVVIPDSSVSRFHAFFKQTPDGRFMLQDAGSTNGTEVNHTPIPAQGEGPPVELKSGDSVTIGQVELRFFDAEAMHRMLFAG